MLKVKKNWLFHHMSWLNSGERFLSMNVLEDNRSFSIIISLFFFLQNHYHVVHRRGSLFFWSLTWSISCVVVSYDQDVGREQEHWIFLNLKMMHPLFIAICIIVKWFLLLYLLMTVWMCEFGSQCGWNESDSEQGLMDEIHVQMNLLFWIYVFMMDVQ